MIPFSRKLGQGDHHKILVGCGIREYLEVFVLNLLIAFQMGIEVYGGEGTFLGVRCLAEAFIRYRNLNGGDLPAAVRQPHGDSGAVGSGDRDGHIL